MKRISEIIRELQQIPGDRSQAAWSRRWRVSEGKLASLRGDSGRLYADIVARECEEQGLDANEILLGRPAPEIERLRQEIEALKAAHELEVARLREQVEDAQHTVRTMRRALEQALDDATERRRDGRGDCGAAAAPGVSDVTVQKAKQ